MSRRKFIATAGVVTASGLLAENTLASVPGKQESAAPSLPWPWVKLDPQEAGERAFRAYHSKGG